MNAEAPVDTGTRIALRELIAFLRIPNSVVDPAAIDRNVDYLLDRLARSGVTARRLEAGGAPYVYGELLVGEDRPTVLVYSHFDGVPSDPDRWTSPPYEPTVRDRRGRALSTDGVALPDTARLYARSAADSKNAIVAVLTALDRVRERGSPAVNLKLLLDGEEERESPTLGALVARHGDLLAADLLLSASGEVHQSGLPTVAFGVRGILTLELVVHTATSDLHSGHFGSFAPNAALVLSRLLAALKDETGRVAIPGFYDDVVPLTELERDLVSRVPLVEDTVQDLFGIAVPERGDVPLQALINEPTLNVRGLEAGYVGEDARNVVPSRASASLDLRLVAGMRPERVVRRLRDWLGAAGWAIVDSPPGRELLRSSSQVLELRVGEGFPAAKSPSDSPYAGYVADAVRRAAGSGRIVIEPTEGGSLKHHVFTDLGMAYAALPTSNFDNNQHTHDENLELRYLAYGVRLFEALLSTRPPVTR